MTSRTLAKKIAEFALTRKANDVVVMDLRKLTTAADFFVICSADSDTQVKAIADSILDGTERIGANVWHSEGMHAMIWVVLDYVDVVVHVFHKEARAFYNLERLWSDAKIVEVKDEAETPAKARAPRPAAPKRKAQKGRTSGGKPPRGKPPRGKPPRGKRKVGASN